MEKPKINKIRAYREALNLSQKEMGKLINVHHVVYSRKERKIVNMKKVQEMFRRLSGVYGADKPVVCTVVCSRCQEQKMGRAADLRAHQPEY